MKYNPSVAIAAFVEARLPVPELEYRFHPSRRWRFDFAWVDRRVALEVDGGIWIKGRHNQGAALKKTWERDNAAAGMGWRILRCEPKDLLMAETIRALALALEWECQLKYRILP